MPVKKPAVTRNSAAKRRRSVSKTKQEAIVEHDGHHTIHEHMGYFGRKILWTLIGILVVYGIVLLGTLIRNNMKEYEHIGQENAQVRTITIESEGEVLATPDSAFVVMGMQTVSETVALAQEENNESMDALMNGLRQLGIEKSDIKLFDYQVYPLYNDEEQGVTSGGGYNVSQQLQVKIRNLNKVQDVFDLAGQVGVDSVGELRFAVDDPGVYYAQARNEAVRRLNEKTEILAQTLGVEFVRIVQYDEFEGGFENNHEGIQIPTEEMGEGGAMNVKMGIRVVFEIE